MRNRPTVHFIINTAHNQSNKIKKEMQFCQNAFCDRQNAEWEVMVHREQTVPNVWTSVDRVNMQGRRHGGIVQDDCKR